MYVFRQGENILTRLLTFYVKALQVQNWVMALLDKSSKDWVIKNHQFYQTTMNFSFWPSFIINNNDIIPQNNLKLPPLEFATYSIHSSFITSSSINSLYWVKSGYFTWMTLLNCVNDRTKCAIWSLQEKTSLLLLYIW